jgi:GTPase SAR1 family protein
MNSLEAKVVILGAQGAGKTSLVVRFVENNFHRNEQSTIGASFLVKKVYGRFDLMW